MNINISELVYSLYTYTHKALGSHSLWFILSNDNLFLIMYRSLFIAWGGGGSEYLGGDHVVF